MVQCWTVDQNSQILAKHLFYFQGSLSPISENGKEI